MFFKSIMVRSVLDDTINYPEVRALDVEDREYDAPVYDARILKKPVVIALGQARYAFVEKNVIYYPIYIVNQDAVSSQIGVYEVLADRVPHILDEDGDVGIGELGQPLLYSYVTPALLVEDARSAPKEINIAPQPKEASEDEEEDEEEYMDDAVVEQLPPLDEQGAIDAKRERSEFAPGPDASWIQRYLSNGNYGIVDNEGAGECLFATIRDGMKNIGQDVTVEGLRAILVDHADKAVFDNYRGLYTDALENLQTLEKELRALAKQHRELKVRKSQAQDRNVQAVLVAQAEEVAEKHREAKAHKAQAARFLAEWEWMKGIDTLEAFHARLQTCEFWGDTWAISTLEVALNIKLVLFSREAYEEGDLDNVLQCGQMNDSTLEEHGIFDPQFYIMLGYMEDHYTLITYKDRGAFAFKELPYDVKRLIVDKCLERMAGAYSLIPEFREFMTQLHVAPMQPTTDLQSDLYGGHTVFQFYSKSNDKPKPGSGSGESMGPEGVGAYSELAAIPSWRRKLSNFWEQEFTLDGKRWLSVEHYYQGAKFKKGHPDFYSEFSLDSGSALSKSPEMAKAAGGKTGKYGKTVIRPSSVKLDQDFFAGRNQTAMEDAMRAKFTQNDELGKLLRATKSAKLQHFSRGAPPVVFDDLMRVRKELRREVV